MWHVTIKYRTTAIKEFQYVYLVYMYYNIRVLFEKVWYNMALVTAKLRVSNLTSELRTYHTIFFFFSEIYQKLNVIAYNTEKSTTAFEEHLSLLCGPNTPDRRRAWSMFLPVGRGGVTWSRNTGNNISTDWSKTWMAWYLM